MPGVLLLDLYDTLVPARNDLRDAMVEATARDLGVDPAGFLRATHESWPARLTGQLGTPEETARTLAVRAGGAPTEAGVRLAAARRRAFTREHLWPSSGTLAALDTLRAAGWRLGLVSNCTVETAELWPTTPLSTRFGAAIFSSVLGVGKPSPDIYLAACSALGVAPVDCVFVGDGAGGELPGAAQLGMTVIRTVEFAPAGSSWPPTRVRSLTDLATLLTSPPAPAPPPVPVP